MINTDFLISNKKQLLDIYKKERYFNNNGEEGALFVNFTDPTKVDVFYWTMNFMPEKYRVKLIEEIKKNIEIKNVNYIVAFDSQNTNIISVKN